MKEKEEINAISHLVENFYIEKQFSNYTDVDVNENLQIPHLCLKESCRLLYEIITKKLKKQYADRKYRVETPCYFKKAMFLNSIGANLFIRSTLSSINIICFIFYKILKYEQTQ